MSKSINHLATADGLFFGKGGLDQRKTSKMVDEALAHMKANAHFGKIVLVV